MVGLHRDGVAVLHDVQWYRGRDPRPLAGLGADVEVSPDRINERSMASIDSCWLMSSCSSRAIRERSVSWAVSRRPPMSRIRS